MKLQMYHGRIDPNEELEDWGFNGPTLHEVSWFKVAYNQTFTIHFETEEAFELAKKKTGWDEWDYLTLEMGFHDDMLMTLEEDGVKYYGDWSIDKQ